MISVITITFNNYDELVNTVNSVSELDYIEHIIINGGKCEKTKRFLEENFKGKYISEPDNGISDAFNKGVRLARGLGIVFLNSGDLYLGKDYYALAENTLIKDSNLDFVHSNLMFKDSIAGDLLMKPTMSSLGSGMPYFHPTMVVRKSVFEKVGYFSLDKKIGMDFDFVCRMEKHKMKGLYIDQAPVVLMDGTGISATQEPRALIECKESLKSHGLYNFTNAKDLLVRKVKLQFRLFLLNNFPSLLIKIKKMKYSK